MKPETLRHEHILGRLATDGRVRVMDMAEHIRVSTETIRRDLKLLEIRGELRRVHGGAVPSAAAQDRPLLERSRIAFREKARIAGLALPLLRPGMRVFLDTGSTTSALARRLADIEPITLVTNSLDIALMAGKLGRHDVRVTAGSVRSNDNALVGPDALDFVRRCEFDLAIVGIASIDAEFGFMDFNEDEAELRRVLVTRAARCVVLADASKLGRPAPVRTLGLGAVDLLVMDREPPEPFHSTFLRAGIEVAHG